MEWDLDSSTADLARALTAASEGFCPDCLLPLGEYGWCAACGTQWRAGTVHGEALLEYTSPARGLSFACYPLPSL